MELLLEAQACFPVFNVGKTVSYVPNYPPSFLLCHLFKCVPSQVRHTSLWRRGRGTCALLIRLCVLCRWSAAPGFSAGSTVTSLSRWMWWCAPPVFSTCVLSALTGECAECTLFPHLLCMTADVPRHLQRKCHLFGIFIFQGLFLSFTSPHRYFKADCRKKTSISHVANFLLMCIHLCQKVINMSRYHTHCVLDSHSVSMVLFALIRGILLFLTLNLCCSYAWHIYIIYMLRIFLCHG